MHRIPSRPLRSLGIATSLLLLASVPLHAHTGAGHTHGFLHGFTHPLGGWDHLLAMIAVGLWAAQRPGHSRWALPAGFVGGMVLGGILAIAGTALPGVESGIVLSVMLLGAFVAASVRMPAAAGIALMAAFGLMHGHAHGAEMPAATSATAYALGFGVATALLHASGVAAAIGIRGVAGRVTAQHAIRVAGSGIAVAGLLLAVVG